METEDADLREDFRRRALASGVAVFVAAGARAGTGSPGRPGAPLMAHGLLRARWAPVLQAGDRRRGADRPGRTLAPRLPTGADRRRRPGLAHPLGLGAGPVSLAPAARLHRGAAASPRPTLALLLVALAAGALILLPSLYYLFRIFKTGRADGRQADVQPSKGGFPLGKPALQSCPTPPTPSTLLLPSPSCPGSAHRGER